MEKQRSHPQLPNKGKSSSSSPRAERTESTLKFNRSATPRLRDQNESKTGNMPDVSHSKSPINADEHHLESIDMLRSSIERMSMMLEAQEPSSPQKYLQTMIPERYHIYKIPDDLFVVSSTRIIHGQTFTREKLFPSSNPSSRKEALHLAHCFRDMMEDIPTPYHNHFGKCLLTVSACLTELMKQISQSCRERGELLGRIWKFFTDVIKEKYSEIDRITDGRIKDGKFHCDCAHILEENKRAAQERHQKLQSNLESLSDEFQKLNQRYNQLQAEYASLEENYRQEKDKRTLDQESKGHDIEKLEDMLEFLYQHSGYFRGPQNKTTYSSQVHKWEDTIEMIVAHTRRKCSTQEVQTQAMNALLRECATIGTQVDFQANSNSKESVNPCPSPLLLESTQPRNQQSRETEGKLSKAVESRLMSPLTQLYNTSFYANGEPLINFASAAKVDYTPEVFQSRDSASPTPSRIQISQISRPRINIPSPSPSSHSSRSMTPSTPTLGALDKPTKSPKNKKKSPSKKRKPASLTLRLVDFSCYEKGTSQPIPKSVLLKIISQIYSDKISADLLDEQEYRSKQSLPEFVYYHFLHKYGMQELSEKHLSEFIESAHQNSNMRRIKLFCRLCGLAEPLTTNHLNVYLWCLSRAAGPWNGINMEDRDNGVILVNTQRAVEIVTFLSYRINGTKLLKLKERIQSKSLNLANIPDDLLSLLPDFKSEVKMVCSPGSQRSIIKLDPTTRVIEFDLMVELVYEFSHMESQDENSYLSHLFAAGDLDNDSSITIGHLISIARLANPSLSWNQLRQIHGLSGKKVLHRLDKAQFIEIGKELQLSESFTPTPKPNGFPDTPANTCRLIQSDWMKLAPLVDMEIRQLQESQYTNKEQWIVSLVARKRHLDQILSAKTDPEKVWICYRILLNEFMLCRKLRSAQSRQTPKTLQSRFVKFEDMLPG
eukprot:TRINITY_DN15878_c0_g1_i1.p1 TRINITY_DN15878_c0_g1~~TRINITY_DN15878_c0_g1_i1.p1  ORF type:complete len:943 (+),score=161.98 TRINITY_DN15878_c0_g1_i1:46-2874(+)